MNALKLGMEKSGFRGREDTMKLVDHLRLLAVKDRKRMSVFECAPADGAVAARSSERITRQFPFRGSF
jgi:hypothetical protein